MKTKEMYKESCADAMAHGDYKRAMAMMAKAQECAREEREAHERNSRNYRQVLRNRLERAIEENIKRVVTNVNNSQNVSAASKDAALKTVADTIDRPMTEEEFDIDIMSLGEAWSEARMRQQWEMSLAFHKLVVAADVTYGYAVDAMALVRKMFGHDVAVKELERLKAAKQAIYDVASKVDGANHPEDGENLQILGDKLERYLTSQIIILDRKRKEEHRKRAILNRTSQAIKKRLKKR